MVLVLGDMVLILVSEGKILTLALVLKEKVLVSPW